MPSDRRCRAASASPTKGVMPCERNDLKRTDAATRPTTHQYAGHAKIAEAFAGALLSTDRFLK
ncbi:MAG: hypothetical protein Q7T08_01265 [Devosia sp.]|nr:hypothetical protein [Devosia sp.]